jgi:hypothetical protein
MLKIVNVCRLPAPPASVWPFYTKPQEWKHWTSDIEWADAKGPLQKGARGRCKYRLLPEGAFVIVEFNPPHSFILDWTTLATRVRFKHELIPVDAHSTHVREQISFHGLLAPVLGLLERPRIRTHWPRAMDRLGALALKDHLANRSHTQTPAAGLPVHLIPPNGHPQPASGTVAP